MASNDLLVLMGGPMGVGQYRKHPWQKQERDFVVRALNQDTRMVGICLGAQIIADALGARVFENDVRDIGWSRIKVVNRSNMPPRLPDSFMAFSWHGDTFDIPKGAMHFAASDYCSNEGFLWRNTVLGLQFHLEADQAQVELMMKEGAGEMLEGGVAVDSADRIRKDSAAHDIAARATLGLLLDHLCGTGESEQETSAR